jgi:hypothetical protein
MRVLRRGISLPRTLTILAIALVPGAIAAPAHAQVFSVRRMAMAGVALRGGDGLTGQNVAYRAVPRHADEGRHISIPLGLIELASHPPVFDPKDPKFNAFELADMLYDLPWNLRLGDSPAPASDIAISIARNRLVVNLGDAARIFPTDGMRMGLVENGPDISFGHSLSIGAGTLIHYQDHLTLNDALQGALANGQAFLPVTNYGIADDAQGQVAAGLKLSYATLVFGGNPDPKQPVDLGVYAGARAKLLRGIAYADAHGVAGVTTPDTLFGNDSLTVNYNAIYRTADPAGGGMGYGLDLGVAAVLGGIEAGIGVNDVSTRIHWKTRLRESRRDSLGNDVSTDLAVDQPFTSTVPTTITANVATHLGPTLLAADAVRGPLEWSAHSGAEQWLGNVALRAGLALDDNREVQYACGAGFKLGHFGIDLALATNSRNVARTRSLELGAGVALY